MTNIAITGITGTFGRAFARRLLSMGVHRVVGISRDELKQSEVAAAHAGDPALRLFLGDVRDTDRLRDAFRSCDTVVHAAALKRVDAVAYNPGEVCKTNISGTENVIRAAVDAGVQRVVVISSDKAVAPSNIYGASKQMAEQIAVHANTHTYPRGTRVSAVRYGNVLGSRGSVIHIWREQAETGQSLTLTDPSMTRFFLTIETGVELVLQTIREMEGGEIFVPQVPSVTMTTVARAVAEYADIKVVGMRPGGEKMHEALLAGEEVHRTVSRNGVYVVTPHVASWRSQPWDGVRLADDDGFSYTSDRGLFGWLSVQDVRGMLARTQA